MSDPFCTHRWDSSNLGNPGLCQCQREAHHFGPHRCCCGATIRLSIDDPVVLAFARRLAARGIVAVPGAEDERKRTRKVLQYLKDSRILEQFEAERKAAAEPPPPPPPTTATLVREVLEQEVEAINKEEARKAAKADNVIPQPSSSARH